MKRAILPCQLIAAFISVVALHATIATHCVAQYELNYGSEPTPYGDTPDSETYLGGDYSPPPTRTAPTFDARPERRAFENVNLAIELPGGPWRALVLPSKNTTAAILVVQQDPEI